jgi:hypothetical protein
MPLTKQEANRIGLCADCVYAKRINNDRGSTFHLCELSKKDPSFPKYPRLPVIQCKGYKKVSE